MLNWFTGLLLKASQDDQISKVRDEEFDQIWRVIRYWAWGILPNWLSGFFATAELSRHKIGPKDQKRPHQKVGSGEPDCGLAKERIFVGLLPIFIFVVSLIIYSKELKYILDMSSLYLYCIFFPQYAVCLFILLMSFHEEKFIWWSSFSQYFSFYCQCFLCSKKKKFF